MEITRRLPVARADLSFLALGAVLKTVQKLSSKRVRESLARVIAAVEYGLSPAKRKQSHYNLVLSFGDRLQQREREKIAREAFFERWLECLSVAPFSSEALSLRAARIEGLEHLRSALAAGKGVIIWESTFFGRRFLAKQILHAHGFRIYHVHSNHHLGPFFRRKRTNTLVEKRLLIPFYDRLELEFLAGIVRLSPFNSSFGYARVFRQLLRDNRIICVSGDVKLGQRFVEKTFLGRTRSFPTGMISLAKMTGAPILPTFCYRDENGNRRVTVHKPIDLNFASAREDMQRSAVYQFTELLEKYVREYPEQTVSWHGQDRLSNIEAEQVRIATPLALP